MNTLIIILSLVNLLIAYFSIMNGKFYGPRYYKLIYSVGNKHPNETRFETALRYIENSEKIYGPQHNVAVNHD